MKNIVTRTMAAGLCALALTASMPQAAQAGNNGKGLAIGIATGLILGGVLLDRAHARPRVTFQQNYDYEDCYRAPVRVRKCWISDFGFRKCRVVTRVRTICE